MKTTEQYYSDNFTKWVNLLTTMIHDREEAEDHVQDIFVRLFSRKEFCEGLIARGEMDKYLWCAVTRQRTQVFREQYKRVPTVSIDADNVDFLSSIQESNQDITATEKVELEDFFSQSMMIGFFVCSNSSSNVCVTLSRCQKTSTSDFSISP